MNRSRPDERCPEPRVRRRPVRRRALVAIALVSLLPPAVRCTSVAQVTTLSDPACRQTLRAGLSKVLEAEGETPPVAGRLAESSTAALQSGELGPRPFLVASPSGVDYSFFVEKKGAKCLLRLYGRQKGFVSYTNNLTYIATEPLAPCECAE
jgi:hypothetical protein